MNERYKQLKKMYEDIDKEILLLHEKQQNIKQLMEEVCPHERLVQVEGDPFGIGDSLDEEVQCKCRDCYRYFNQEQVEGWKNKN